MAALTGGLSGSSAAVVERLQGLKELAQALVEDFGGTSEQVALALLAAAASPDRAIGDFQQARMDAENEAYLYRLQGDHESAAYVEEKWKTDFALNFVAASRAGVLGRVGDVEENATGGKVAPSEAINANAQAALRAKLSGLQKAQATATITKVLPDGRIRYYTQEVPARTEGATRGASFVTELDPRSGNTRQWMESYDHSGSVVRAHPKSINGQPVNSQHYPPTGTELRSWGK